MVEDKNDSSTLSYADINDNNNDDSINPVEKTAKKVVTEIKEALSSGAKGIEKKVVPTQDVIKEGGGQNDIEKVVKGVVNEAKEIIHEGARSAEQKIKEGQENANSPRPSTIRVSKPENYHNDKEAEIIKKVKRAASDLKDIILSAATITERRVKEFREAEEERQVEIDAENISKMGSLATQFTNSFEDVLSEIRTRTYAEQEQIYIGFLKLIEQQRELIVARKDLSARLKASVRKPVVVITGSEEDIDKLPKNIEVPQIQGQQQPQLPEEMDSQEQSKQAEPFIMTDEPTEQAAVIQKSSQPLESSTEIPAAEIQANITTDDENEESKKKFQSSKKSKYNKKNVKTRTSD